MMKLGFGLTFTSAVFTSFLWLSACESTTVTNNLASPTTGGSGGGTENQVALACAEDPDKTVEVISYAHLMGAMHEHSGFSDGEVGTTPVDYFQAARVLGLAFLGSAEHSDNAVLPITLNQDCISDRFADCLLVPAPGQPVSKFELAGDIADAASDASFSAIRGFEWTSDRFGHANIFFSQNDLNAKTTDGFAGTMEGLWTWFALDPNLGGGADGLLVFNHPGREDAVQSNIPDPAFTFNDFEYRADVADRVVGVEVFGKSSDVYDLENGAPPEGWYARALDRDWHLGPVGAEDEHGTEWAKPERAKTVVLADANSRNDIRAALLARRFYALAQNQNSIRLEYRADGLAMGSHYQPPLGTVVTLSAGVLEGFPVGGALEIVSNLGEIIVNKSTDLLQQTVTVENNRRWYYLRVLDAAGIPVAYSSPIWLQAGSDTARCAN